MAIALELCDRVNVFGMTPPEHCRYLHIFLLKVSKLVVPQKLHERKTVSSGFHFYHQQIHSFLLSDLN